MIVVDTSALMAILLDEPEAERCSAILEAEERVLMSAGSFAEALIVAGGRSIFPRMLALIEDMRFEIVAVSAASAKVMAQAHQRWGRGAGTAGLNFGDCFAYTLAQANDCPLLFVGNDFSKTDIRSALA